MTKYTVYTAYAYIDRKHSSDVRAGVSCHNETAEIVRICDTLADAEALLATLCTEVEKEGRQYRVEEAYIVLEEYDEDGEWVDGTDVLTITPMQIEVWAGLDTIATFDNLADAEAFVDDHNDHLGEDDEEAEIHFA